ncbi:MAG: hypothetical protein KAU89_08870 [Candidatus Thorarchaeota archaeon]|nr:hypothetical protein [Candidatus Thorarchaeota archaeon]
MMTVADAKRVAQKHYDLLQQDDITKWAETLNKEGKKKALNKVYGDSPDFWWKTGRRYFEQYGVHYKFNRVDQEKENYCKLFFTRYNADGSERGMPVPIHVVRENGAWKVKQASY